ncbi:MAG: hypothetical protein AAF211_30275 [Myxococcota bacterium]
MPLLPIAGLGLLVIAVGEACRRYAESVADAARAEDEASRRRATRAAQRARRAANERAQARRDKARRTIDRMKGAAPPADIDQRLSELERILTGENRGT